MNQYLKNLNKIEFVVTYACTGRCKHCSEGDHTACGERIDPGIAADAMRKIAAEYDIKTVMTFGGEPLLYTDATYAIMTAAKELNIPIIALSQLNRAAESRTGSKRPQLSDLRESGAIEQDADVVALIHRPEYYGFTQTDSGESTAGLTEIILAKHRNGEVRDIKLRFIKDQAKFVNWDQTPIQATSAQGDFDMVESQTFQTGVASPLQSATSNEFDLQQVNIAPQDEAPF